MSTSSNNDDNNQTPPSASTVILLLGTIGDTTWRMFVPTIGLTILGVYLDNQFDTKPWLTVAGIVIGTVIAGLLIRSQLRNVQKVNK